MWVDMFPMDAPAPGPALDISPRKPKKCVTLFGFGFFPNYYLDIYTQYTLLGKKKKAAKPKLQKIGHKKMHS